MADCRGGRAIALYVVNPSSIPSILSGPLSLAEVIPEFWPGTSSECH